LTHSTSDGGVGLLLLGGPNQETPASHALSLSISISIDRSTLVASSGRRSVGGSSRAGDGERARAKIEACDGGGGRWASGKVGHGSERTCTARVMRTKRRHRPTQP
jgi:hypothetical protein